MCSSGLAWPLSTSAQLPLQTNGLRGGRFVGSAGNIDSTPRLLVGLGLAHTEDVLRDDDRHLRVAGELAAAYAPWRLLQLSLGLDARRDAHHGRAGDDHGFTVGSALETRHAFALTRVVSLAARTKLRFPPAQSLGRGFRSASPELAGIGTANFQHAGELSLELGYRVDRSERSVDASRLSRADLLGASISRFDAALLGALYVLPLGPVTASAEWSWEIATGSGSPSAFESPMRARVAAQTLLGQRFVPGVELGVSPSARPRIETLARIEPRFWFGLTLGVLLERRHDREERTRSRDMDVEAPLLLQIADPAGQPLSNVSVVRSAAPDDLLATTGEDGVARLALSSRESHALTISGEGFEPQQLLWDPAQPKRASSITLVRVLREGEIKGTVRSLRGGLPLAAEVTVQPLGKTVSTDSQGGFVVGVPPGSYELEISAPGHVSQHRTARVERLGVTILVIDLHASPHPRPRLRK